MKGTKTALLVLCLVSALLLTACHTDADPWPASANPTAATETAQPNATDVAPQNEPTVNQTENQTENQAAPGLNG
ncbi:MAG: hypothetical protein PHI98_00845 [Eubacteriales bacterium]|nr:hypothetical protein [Eubacteriales bacterium]